MHVKEGQEEEYIRRHRDVWPQVLADLEKAGGETYDPENPYPTSLPEVFFWRRGE